MGDLQPTTVETGTTTTLVGTGTVDEDVSSAQFTAVAKAFGVKFASCSGDGATDILCKFPAGAGLMSIKAFTFPIPAGQVTVPVEVTTSALLPASLANVDVHIAAVDQNGEGIICLDVNIKKALESTDVDCSTATCPDQCQCGLDKCRDVINTCLADDACAASQDCAFGCACSDTACALKCAASSPSTKALPVATCLNSNCASTLKEAAVDCSKATCPENCQCGLDKCTDVINTCLADDACAAGQDCAFGCACGDTACALKCAASSPSAAALPVATCLNSNCASTLGTAAVDCSTATCPDQCQCGLDKCSDVINTCLADDACAASQDCAFGCACSDTACALKCAASSPSAAALPVATCLNKNCASFVV